MMKKRGKGKCMGVFKNIGKDVPRSNALEIVTGRALFTTDMKVPHMLHGKILRSPYVHARIRKINVSEVGKVPGIKAVLTRDDIDRKFNQYGHNIMDQTILAIDKVRYLGEPVAAVAAMDIETAEKALSFIKVEYEELKGVSTIDEAVASNDHLVHDKILPNPVARDVNPIQGTNICHHFKLRHGDIEKGFKESDLIFEDIFTTDPTQHAALEPHCSIGRVLSGPRVEVLTNNQNPSTLQIQLCHIFNLPQSNVRVMVPSHIGGGFGSKLGPKLEPLAIALAWKAGWPVRVALTVEEEFLTTRRLASKIIIKTGVKKDGTLMARQMAIYLDTGAYAGSGPTITKQIGSSAAGPYRIPHVKIDSYCIYSNRTPGGPMRGYGVPQAAWAYEQQMDMIAEKLGMDPLEIRKKNILRNGNTFHTGEMMEGIDFEHLLDEAAKGIAWNGPKKRDMGRGVSRGKGICVGLKSTATPTTSIANVKMNSDGSVILICNTIDMGQGSRTILKQLIAEELGLPLERVSVQDSDTNVAPFDSGTYSSRSTFHMGNAVILAAEDLKKELLGAASIILDSEEEDLLFTDGFFRVKGSPSKSVSLAQAAKGPGGNRGSLIGHGVYQTKGSIDKETGQGTGSFYWMSASGGVEVEVDKETGIPKVLKYIGVTDAGKAINPLNVEQQIMGSIVMALGHTLTEHMVFDERGMLLNPNWVDYGIPAVKDLPDETVGVFAEIPNPKGPFGAKGMGEISIVPPMAAIANAIKRATGVRIKDFPLTPEKIVENLEKK